MVTIRLTDKEANLVWRNADGWMDAGACNDGLEPDEMDALQKLCQQILDQTVRKKNAAKKSKLTPEATHD